MSDEVYVDPYQVPGWSEKVLELLTEGSPSIYSIGLRFQETINDMITNKLWSGTAAAANYKNFTDAYNAMVDYFNLYCSSYTTAYNEVFSAISTAETASLGNSLNISSIEAKTLAKFDNITVEEGVLTYSTSQIKAVASTLGDILTNFSNVAQELYEQVKKVGGSSDIWHGTVADTFSNTLSTSYENNVPEIEDTLRRCITNIETAAENMSGF